MFALARGDNLLDRSHNPEEEQKGEPNLDEFNRIIDHPSEEGPTLSELNQLLEQPGEEYNSQPGEEPISEPAST